MTLRRTLQRSLSTTTRGLSQFGSGGVAPPSYDTDAQTYITAVEAADGQSLETGVKDAINAFVVGCKADGIWTAIKASCILAGARTLSGALVPLVGTAPTNNNFVSGDYSRTAGLTGDGSTKYLNSNRANNADPQNSQHLAAYVTTAQATVFGVYIGASDLANPGASHVGSNPSTGFLFSRSRNSSVLEFGDSSNTGFVGKSRAGSGNYSVRSSGTSEIKSQVSNNPSSDNVAVFFRIGATTGYSNAQLAFYSIGESLDLALLDSRVTTLITDIGTALA